MQQVAIIGAGELGGAVAHVLARRNLVRSIVLVVEVMAGRTRRVVSCFVAPDGAAAGAATRTAAVPVRLSASGVVEVVLPPLGAIDRLALDNAIQL